MEIKKIMNVPANYLFDVFTRSIQNDIYEQTGEEVSLEDFEGFEYVKTFSENSQALIRIDKFELNRAYHYSTNTDKNHIKSQYDIKELDEEKCELDYSETLTSHGFIQKINDTFVGFIWSYLKKRRFNQMLDEIEQSYEENK